MDSNPASPLADPPASWHRVEELLRTVSAHLTDVQSSLDAAFHGEANLSAVEQQAILSRLEEAHAVIEQALAFSSTPT